MRRKNLKYSFNSALDVIPRSVVAGSACLSFRSACFSALYAVAIGDSAGSFFGTQDYAWGIRSRISQRHC